MDLDALKKYLSTPKDISKESLEKKSTTICLWLIGYIAKPIGVSDEILEKCCEAFNKNRGKVEYEEEAIFNVLKSYEA
jgi:hypothetical protein